MVQHHLVYAIVGSSRFLQGETLAQVLRSLGEDTESLAPVRFDGKSVNIATVLDEVRTVSLLSDHRIGIVDDADTFVSENREALERYCARPADSGTLILLCNSMPKTTRLYKAIKKTGQVLTLDIPKGRAVAGWATQRARTTHGKNLSPRDAQRLVEQLGDSLGAIDSELAKLAAYSDPRDTITGNDIATLTGHDKEEKVFAVIDAISIGDASGALRHWEQVLATNRAAPALALAGLAWGVRRMLEARNAWDNGATVGELARRLYTDPTTVQKRLDRYTVQQWEDQQKDLLNADVAVKTGAATVGLAVESFIVKHAARSSARSKAV